MSLRTLVVGLVIACTLAVIPGGSAEATSASVQPLSWPKCCS